MSKKKDDQILDVRFQSLFHKEVGNSLRRFHILFGISITLNIVAIAMQFVDVKALLAGLF